MSTRAAAPSTTPSSRGAPSISVCSSSLNRSSLGCSRRDLGDEVGEEGLHRANATLLVVGKLEHVTYPSGKGVGELARNSEDAGDDADRDLLGVVLGRIGVTGLDERVDERRAEVARHGFVAVDLAVGEPR
jgi:hypothetical protein